MVEANIAAAPAAAGADQGRGVSNDVGRGPSTEAAAPRVTSGARGRRDGQGGRRRHNRWAGAGESWRSCGRNAAAAAACRRNLNRKC